MPLDDLHKRYINDIAERYSIGRAFTVFIWLLFFYTFFELKNFEFITAISKISVAFIFDMNEGFLKKTSLQYVLYSFGATLIIVKINSFIRIRFSSCLIKLLGGKTKEYQEKLSKQLDSKSQLDREQRQNVNNQLTHEKIAYRRLQGASEVVLSLCIGSSIGHLSFSLLEFVFALIMLCSVFYFQWEAFKRYISEIYPCLVALDHGLSQTPPTLTGVINSL